MIKPSRKLANPVSVDNRFKVPAKQWDKWSDHARGVFNSLFGQLSKNKDIVAPSSMHGLTQRAWYVLCWNVCWLAADAVDGK